MEKQLGQQYIIYAEKHKIGGTLQTRDDFINLFIHERGSHIPDLKNNAANGLNPVYVESRDRDSFERNAIRMQVGREHRLHLEKLLSIML